MPLSDAQGGDVIEVGEQFYIRASSSLADARTRVLMNGDTFAIFDRSGDIQPVGVGQQGIFHKDARHLSRLDLNINGLRPLLLSSTIREDNLLFAIDLTNPDLKLADGSSLGRGTLHVYRTKILSDSACYDRITVHNYGDKPADVDLEFEFDADFRDIFEVRGEKRARRGYVFPHKVESSAVTVAYAGLDGVKRATRVVCTKPSSHARDGGITVAVHLEPQEKETFTLTIEYWRDAAPETVGCYEDAMRILVGNRAAGPLADVEIDTSSEQFNAWFRRSKSDLAMMLVPTPNGLYPYAGVPWFSTIFGRDGIICALELLWLAPSVARGVLACLAATQATEVDPQRDAEPGKILHETRKGEMAELGEVPFGRYYGSVDATPLFIVLAVAYYERTADLEFLRGIWPNLLAALDWIDRYGDKDRDGFVEYARQAGNGLVQQGWKDSNDSIFHSDGELAKGPIALCEVQSYVYAAKRGVAGLARDMGDPQLGDKLSAEAAQLRTRFTSMFWCEKLAVFALALDGEKRQCQVRSSNAGQCLFSGIASEAQYRQVSEALLTPPFYTGWGIRTVVTGEHRYNPMSYHNGSVWPHDNALIAWGALGSNQKRLALRVLSGLLDLSTAVNLHRLPELICGFARRPGKGPTLYPVACSPQAWAAGAVFMALQACLGLEISAREKRVYLHHSALPENLKQVHVSNLKIGDACLDLSFERSSGSTGVDVRRRVGDVEIIAVH